MLRAELDSLRMEVERYRAELEYTDSITSEMMDMYEENEMKGENGLAPEDYTAEVSDSLLNIWYTAPWGDYMFASVIAAGNKELMNVAVGLQQLLTRNFTRTKTTI